jgi:hypothetical protein
MRCGRPRLGGGKIEAVSESWRLLFSGSVQPHLLYQVSFFSWYLSARKVFGLMFCP